MVINKSGINNLNNVLNNHPVPKAQKTAQNTGAFENILQEKTESLAGLKFSKHAQERLGMRNIKLSPEQKDRMSLAVEKAEKKGVKDSLVLMDNMAFIVNVTNKTVITAVNSSELKDNVFTNIDGAVFI